MKTRFFALGVLAVIFLMTGTLRAGLTSEPSRAEGEIVVTQALFGSGNKVADVTRRVNELIHSEAGRFNAVADDLLADPVPAQAKALVIAYDYRGRHCLFIVPSKKAVTYKDLVENAER